MDNLDEFCCLNPDCPDYGQRGGDNSRVGFRNGPNKQRRVLACRTCQQRFCERKGAPLYRGKLAEHKVLSVLQHLAGTGGPEAVSTGHTSDGCRSHGSHLDDSRVGELSSV